MSANLIMSIAKLQVPPQAKRGEIVEIRVAIQHPMETGFRRDNFGKAIPKNTINNLVCHYNGVEVFRAENGIGASRPIRTFNSPIVAEASGNIELDWVDDAGEKGSASAAIAVSS
jgi:sulfur-oxidizing protein SoxZ